MRQQSKIVIVTMMTLFAANFKHVSMGSMPRELPVTTRPIIPEAVVKMAVKMAPL
jgi:hypothetical protein